MRSGQLAVQSLRDHLSVHDGDVHEEKQDYKEIVQETQKTEQGFREDVKWRGQVGEGTDQAEQDSNPEHPEETPDGEHLPEGVTEQGGHIPQPVHIRSWLAGESAVIIIDVSQYKLRYCLAILDPLRGRVLMKEREEQSHYLPADGAVNSAQPGAIPPVGNNAGTTEKMSTVGFHRQNSLLQTHWT